MKPYRSLFKESDKVVPTWNDAHKTTNIRNLIWDDRSYFMTWDQANSSCPKGYRLPTVQELYTVFREFIEGFKDDYYWSSSLSNEGSAWYVNLSDGGISNTFSSSEPLYVRYVKI